MISVRLGASLVSWWGEVYENLLSNQHSDSQNEHTGIQRRYLDPQGDCSSWSAKTLSPPQNKYLHWQSCPLPPRPQSEGGCWHRRRRLIWCEQTSPHTSQFGSPQLARMAGKMSVAWLQKSKFRLTWVCLRACGLTRAGPPLTRCGKRARDWSDTSEQGWLSIARGGGRGGEREEEGRSGYFEATGEGKCQIWLASRLVLEYAWH